MTKQDVLDGISSIIDSFAADSQHTLTGLEQTTLTDMIAGYCETVNPTNDYPPTPR